MCHLCAGAMLICSVSFQFQRTFSLCACHPCAGAMLIFSVSCQFQRTFSICACHPCAGAMLICSVSFQLQRMILGASPHPGATRGVPLSHFQPSAGGVRHPPMLLVTNHVIEFSRLSWPRHDAMIRAGIMLDDPQPARTRSPFPKPVMAERRGP